jgi:acyl-CoA thioesterase-1
MKKYIFSAAIVFGLLIGFSFIGCDNGSINNSHDTTLVCLGNSLTAGYGAITPGVDDKSNSYPAYLQNKINIPVVNAGVSGDTTLQSLSRIDTDVLSKNPRIVIIELGANDVFQRIPIKDTRDNLRSIIDKLNDGNRKIYLARFYTDAIARAMANDIGITNFAMQTLLINQYNTMFNTLASSNNVVLIDDIWDGVWGIHMSDSVHPNAAGYEIMANNYFKILQPYLQANGLLK